MGIELLEGKVKIPGYGSGGMSAAAPLASSGEEERTSSTSEAASPSSSPCLRASKLNPDQRGYVVSSVADPGCLSRILIFTHPGSKNKREG